MVKILAQRDDFWNEQTIVEFFYLPRATTWCVLSNLVWAQAKVYTRAHCNYSLCWSPKNSWDCTQQYWQSSHSKVLLRLHQCILWRGIDLEKVVKKYKSYRRILNDKWKWVYTHVLYSFTDSPSCVSHVMCGQYSLQNPLFCFVLIATFSCNLFVNFGLKVSLSGNFI